MTDSSSNNTCKWYGCSEMKDLTDIGNIQVCEFHRKGGIFSTGDLYEQYAIIEEDFINILKYIPLQEENFNVFSPRFSDILIRCCVAIEVYFREWLNHYEFSNNEKVQKIREKSKQNINDFCIAFSDRIKDCYLKTRQLNTDVYPFKNWTEHCIPNWWDTYNNIKHPSMENKNSASLEMALNALAALFLLHCEQTDSLTYLYKFSSTSLISRQWVRLNYIKTPLESRRYLFLYEIPQNSPAHRDSH